MSGFKFRLSCEIIIRNLSSTAASSDFFCFVSFVFFCFFFNLYIYMNIFYFLYFFLFCFWNIEPGAEFLFQRRGWKFVSRRTLIIRSGYLLRLVALNNDH